MGRRVFLSFLGLGPQNGYFETNYSLNTNTFLTKFVQVAELKMSDTKYDKIVIITTKKAYERNYQILKNEILANIGEINLIDPIILNESDLSSESQWKWFEIIYNSVSDEDELTIDLTHGYRMFSIIFSAIINFLQKMRRVKLNAVYYGAFEYPGDVKPIMDMKDFYIINEWSDAVSRLVDNADASKIIDVAQKADSFQGGDLKDENIQLSLTQITDGLRNVDVNHISQEIENALNRLVDSKKDSVFISKLFIDLIIKKFTKLKYEKDIPIKYNIDYFKMQLKIINMLNKHKLYMQSFTAMREFIVSIGMIYIQEEKTKVQVSNKEGRNKRKIYAEIFFNMLQFDEEKWIFDKNSNEYKLMIVFYEKLKEKMIVGNIKNFIKELTSIRNGFDHAWMSGNTDLDSIDSKANDFYKKLLDINIELQTQSILKENP